MIQTRINHADISWEEFPILAFNPDLNVIIIALENGDYLKGAICYTETDNFIVGIYSEKWDKSEFTPFLGEMTLKNDL